MTDIWNTFSTPETFWIALGLLLIILEFIVPGLVVLFFGLGALVTGAACYLFDIDQTSQIFLFSVFSLATLFVCRRFLLPQQDTEEKIELEGETAIVTDAIAPPRKGRIQVNGAEWDAKATENIAAGKAVTIVTRENLTFIVKPISEN